MRQRGEQGPRDERWYWRAEVKRRPVWRGWATRDELPRLLAEVLLSDRRPEPQVADVQTVAALVAIWVDTVVQPTARSGATLKAIRGSQRRIDAALGSTRLDRLSRMALDAWVGARLRRGDSALTIGLDLTTLRRAWRWGRQVGCCPDRDLPVPAIRPIPKRPRRTPTLGEVAQVVRHLEAHAPPWASALVRLQAALGCRVGELASLTWDRVDLDEQLLELQGKTGSRVVPLRPDLVPLLRRLPRTSPRVLGVTEARVHTGSGAYLRAACDALRIERFTTHGLRRLAVDTLARAGVDVGTAAALLGHSPATMLRYYRQVGLAERRSAVAHLGHLPRGEVIELQEISGHKARSQR